MSYRIRVIADRGVARVRLKKLFSGFDSYIDIARIDLTADDADDRLADARARAVALAHQVNGLERDRL